MAKQQRPVLSGPDREMDVGLLGGFGPQWVDDDDRRRPASAASSARRHPPGTVSSQFHALTAGLVPTSRK